MAAQDDEVPHYLLQEPFYDNLVLWEIGEDVWWEGDPAPSMIPLNEAAIEKMKAYMKSRGITDWVPPVSEIPDSMDGRVTVQPYLPDRRVRPPASNLAKPVFPVTPGKPGANYTSKGAKGKGEVVAAALNVPSKTNKNFDRAPR